MKTKRILAACFASLAAILLVGPAIVSAEELSYSELAERLTALESELRTQRMDFASYSGGGPEQVGGKDCGKSYWDDGCPAWYAGYEITFLKPYISDNEFVAGFGDGYGTGHRFVIGYDDGNGLGARVRYWLYNHNHNTAAGAPFVHIDMDVLDGEVTLQERMRNWDLLVSGGIRYARASFGFPGGNLFYEGVGPTVSLEATRGIGSRGLYLIGNFRASMLYGDIVVPGGGFQAAHDETTLVFENQLGVGWSREYGRGVLNVRGVWESQYWFNNSLGDDVFGFSSALAFAGPTASVEFRY
ncbi:MAG TPA: Lpg1974 family pore-forming outer membrane protein [Pirellulaceae bacterium]|nr:Lpg1974 family pore-forming outer membrane protein [Pirellulaceae bacterium]